MKVLDIISDITLAELMMQDRYDSGDLNELTVVDINRLISLMNRGLTELHRRFHLKYNTHEFNVSKDLHSYDIPEQVIEILKIRDIQGRVLPFNRDDCEESIHQIKVHTLQVPKCYHGQKLIVDVLDGHPKIEPVTLGLGELADKEIDLPEVYREALIMFMASRLTSSLMNGAFANYPESQNYFQRFENICAQLMMDGVDVDKMGMTPLFYEKGFV